MKKSFITLLLFSLFSLCIYADTFTEDFQSGITGWNTSEGSLSTATQATTVLDFQANSSNTKQRFNKTFLLGATPNSAVTITFDAWATGGWEDSSSSNVDFIYLDVNSITQINGTDFPGTNGSNDPVYNSWSVTGLTDASGNVNLEYAIDVSSTGEHLQLDNIVITYIAGPANAVNDSFSTSIDTVLTENVFTNDGGPGIEITNVDTSTLLGTITPLLNSTTGDFTYTPPLGFLGNDTFSYTITDDDGLTDTATVTIDVSINTVYSTGTTTPFVLTNPPETRNVRGDFVISGNTVTCLTSATSGYSTGACLDDGALTSNNRVNRYIDIDGNASTWNSTSSYVTLPPSFEPAGGRGIAWAGLFWQGRINSDTTYVEHFAQKSGTGFTYVETGSGSGYGTVNISTTDANKVLLKTDTGSYSEAKATTLHQYASSGGETYAAYADVTHILQDQNLTSGKHTFTVANLTTNEGREGSPGLFGGWSLVVIYLQDFNGTPRNISIYSGFDIVGNPSAAIPITGFKLPTAGAVQASLGIFSGEGELLYAPDSIEMSGDGSSYDPMPNDGSFSSTNVFDAQLTGITRDISPNDTNVFTVNNTGLDVDTFDVSNLVTTYRDADPDVDTLYIRWRSGGDYITPSMMVFSTELYQPSVCYDYTYDFDGYVIPSLNSDLNTTFQNLGLPLTTHLTVRSIEGDFDLSNTIVTVDSDLAYLTYVPNTAAYAGNSINAYVQMLPPELNVTSSDTFRMSIGSGADAYGGTIKPYETHYMRFQHDLNASQSSFDTRLNISLQYTTDYGSGPVPIHTALTVDDRCTGYTSYQPEWGFFNIIDGNAATLTTYNLKAQATKRAFSAKAVGYSGPNFDIPTAFDTDIEVEVFNVGIYGTDTNVSCNNPDSNISQPSFISFNNTSESLMPNISYDRANKNSGFRVWYLQDKAGNLVEHHSGSTIPGADEAYFDALYTTAYPTDANCTVPCSGASTGCYTCLRTYYGKPLCSRDNFSIRPENFSLSLVDHAEWDPTVPAPPIDPGWTSVGNATTITPNKVVGGYKYEIQAIATNYGDETPARGYSHLAGEGFVARSAGLYTVNEDLNHTASMINLFDTNANCNDIKNEAFKFEFWDGKDTNYSVVVRNVGDYKFHMLETDWTFVDNPGNFPLNPVPDCIAGDASTPATGDIGCNVSSNADATHNDLYIRSYPYQFNMGAIATISPALADGYMYSNQLNNLLTDVNMSLNFRGLVSAEGKDSTAMSNFTSGCYSQDLKLSVDFNMTGEDQNGVPWTGINGTLAEGNPIRWRELNASLANGTFPLPLGRSQAFGNFSDVNLTGTEFSKALNGATNLDLYINIDRNVTTPHNPIQASFNSLNVTCENNKCDAAADNIAAYEPSGIYLNPAPVMNIFYARAHTPRYRVAGNTVAGLRSYYEVYCVNCDVPRLQIVSPGSLLSVDDTRWFQNTIHTPLVGDIPAANAMSTQNPAQAARFTLLGANRVTTAVTASDFTYDGVSGYPYKATITYTPDPWLVYSRFDNTATLNTFELEFFNAGAWGGNDNTGGTNANTNSSVNTNRRIQW